MSKYLDQNKPKSIAIGINQAAIRSPDKIAIQYGDQKLTYKDLVCRIDNATRAAATGSLLKPGDHVAIVSKNRIEYVEITCGLPQAKNPVATISSKLSSSEISAICDDARAKVLFVDEEAADLLADAQFQTVHTMIKFGAPYEAWLKAAAEDAILPEIAETDIWTIPYTSGTTGKPKGVLISHASRVDTCIEVASEYGCFGENDRFLAFAPMNHGAGIIFALAPLFFGGFVEFLDKFNPETVLKRLKQGKASGVFMVPTHFHGIFDLDRQILETYKTSELKTIISNAAPLPQSTKEKIVAYFGEGLLNETYGSTEGGIVSNLQPADQLRKSKCVGRVFPKTTLKILNSEGKECGPGEVGEIYTKSPYLFAGYWQKPEETASAFKDGWLTVGDMALLDDEGYLYIVDRKKDMVISGGINIYPREIEEVLLAQPHIQDTAVIGIPDEKWGEHLKAFIVYSGPESADIEKLKQKMAASLARYKIPKEFECMDAIPRNAAGKILKDVLRQRER